MVCKNLVEPLLGLGLGCNISVSVPHLYAFLALPLGLQLTTGTLLLGGVLMMSDQLPT